MIPAPVTAAPTAPIVHTMGRHFDDLGKHPRAELLKRLGYKHASRMFQDRKNGPPMHIGYVIGPHWVTLYNVTRW